MIGVFFMKINSINPGASNYQHNFQMKLIQTPSLKKYINSFHFREEQNNLKEAFSLISDFLTREPNNSELNIYALHPSKANYVKNGTYDEFYYSGENRIKQTFDRFGRENIYMQMAGSNKTQNFYMNPQEKPDNLARWFMETFNFYKKNL